MKKIKINILENNNNLPCGHQVDEGCGCEQPSVAYSNSHNSEESRMHRTTLAHLVADVKVLLDLIQDGDDLPEWLETKITKAGDYMSSAARYISGNVARDHGQLEENSTLQEGICEVDSYYSLYEQLQDAIDEDGNSPCPECLYEAMVDADCGCPDVLTEAEYKGRKVKLNKRMRGDVKKFKVFVKGCGKDKSRVKKINFGDKNMKIKKNIPGRRKSFRARHKCHTAKDKCTARYWSCKAW
tara:strand:- start:3672 stop:4394 length:723 start_codon:yes stop_codon:yes gene_type:complete